jgi:hypothetical protein
MVPMKHRLCAFVAIAAERGVIANIEAEVDATRGQIHAQWRARETVAGPPSQGTWLAEKISSRGEIDLDF